MMLVKDAEWVVTLLSYYSKGTNMSMMLSVKSGLGGDVTAIPKETNMSLMLKTKCGLVGDATAIPKRTNMSMMLNRCGLYGCIHKKCNHTIECKEASLRMLWKNL